MAYNKGAIKVEQFDYDGRIHVDYRLNFGDKLVASLPHSCDNWVIGRKKEVRQMIKDLQEILKEFE